MCVWEELLFISPKLDTVRRVRQRRFSHRRVLNSAGVCAYMSKLWGGGLGFGCPNRGWKSLNYSSRGWEDWSGLLWLWHWCLIGVVVSNLVFQLIIRQEVQGTSLHLNRASAWTTGGEAYGATAPAGDRQVCFSKDQFLGSICITEEGTTEKES